ncbi:MAG: ChaN family lipoprotein [Leptolyngbyaceae cyanobacterium MO_188.B28]|nr:ChaN family lipoprotein [Leptolyngbyaceae cyanobacterium MO_188.B28]
MFVFCASPLACSRVNEGDAAVDISVQPQAPQDDVLQSLFQADVVYLGETHDILADHQAQLAIIQALHRQNPELAIALEMFQRPYQSVLDQYLAAEITEAELVELSQYEQRWGFPWEYYAPIIRFARDNQLPLIALNAPNEVPRKVARQGLESLSEDERQYIPPLSEIRTDNSDYRQLVQQAFGAHHAHAAVAGMNFENFFAAQVVWDETMAAGIANFLQQAPERQVVVLAGQGHVIYGYGIPSRVVRRMGDDLVQRTVLLNPSEAILDEGEGEIADHFWVSE